MNKNGILIKLLPDITSQLKYKRNQFNVLVNKK